MKTKTDKLAELKAKQAEEMAAFETETKWREALPQQYREDASICIHGKFVSIKLWNDFRTEKKLADAIAALDYFKGAIVEGEHWKDGCISTWPEAINGNAKKEHAVMECAHAVEIDVGGGKGFGPDVAVQFWIEFAGLGLAEISAPVCDLWKLVPRVNCNYNRDGDVTSGEIKWPRERAVVDKFRSFGTGGLPAYRGSYYFADYHNFMAWAAAWAGYQTPKAKTESEVAA